MAKEINLTLNGAGDHVIRFGEAEKIFELQQATTHTDFSGLVKYVSHRNPSVATTIIECNAEKLHITLNEDKKWSNSEIVYATELVNPMLDEFGINNGKVYDRKQLVDFIKKYRHLLVADNAAKILASLSNLTAKIEKSIEQGENNKGSKHNTFSQNINLNTAPENLNFSLSLPLIVGQPKVPILIDICYDSSGNSVVFWLECADLTALIEDSKEKLVEDVKEELGHLGYLVIDTTK